MASACGRSGPVGNGTIVLTASRPRGWAGTARRYGRLLGVVTDTGHERVIGAGGDRLRVEANGINVIAREERGGRPRELFWPWFGANVSIFGLSYGAFALGFGISFWQAVVVGALGIVFSFALCGVIAVAGKRGSAPMMVLSRAAFGVRGTKLPAVFSWLLTVGWETVLVVLATLATASV